MPVQAVTELYQILIEPVNVLQNNAGSINSVIAYRIQPEKRLEACILLFHR